MARREQRQNLRERSREMRGDPGHQHVPLRSALVRDAELSGCQIPQPAVDELGTPPARAVREVAALDQHRAQSPAGGIQSQSCTGDAAADDENIDVRIVAEHRQLPVAGARR